MILPNKYIVLDLETANRERASICQIGITYIINQTVQSIKTVNINPECSFTAYNMNLHGITANTVKESKTFKEIYPILKKILALEAVFHHGIFDPQAVNQTCSRYGLAEFDVNWRNSIDYFKYYWPSKTEKSYSLKELCKANNIKIEHHNAGEDSLATSQLLNLAAHNKSLNIPQRFLAQKVKGIFSGETIVFSGDMDKSKLKKEAKSVGFEILENVTKRTDYLCLGAMDQRTLDSGNTKSGKHKKAENLKTNGHHIQIINEQEFLHLISQ